MVNLKIVSVRSLCVENETDIANLLRHGILIVKKYILETAINMLHQSA